MTTLAEQSAQYSELRAIGATPSEAILALSVIAEVDRAIELVGPKGYVHGWKYVGPGGAPSSEARHIMRMQAKRRAAESVRQIQRRMSEAAQEPPAAPVSRAHVSQEEAQQIAQHTVARAHELNMKQILAEVHQATERYHSAKEARQETAEKKRRTRTLAVHVGVIAAGGILAGIEAKLGTPGLVQIASALTPQVLAEVVDKVAGTG